MVELRVPHPGLADPAPRAAAFGLRVHVRTTSGGSRATPFARRSAPSRSRIHRAAVERADRADLRRLLHAEGRAGVRVDGARGTTGSATTQCRAQGPGADGAAPAGRRLLHDPDAAGRAPPPTRRVAYRSRYVHIAVGYPGLKLLPDLQRTASTTATPSKVVNAYEPHEHVYEQLAPRPGTVMIRGGGIVASRVLQRLIDDRDSYGLQTQIVHVFRTYITGAHGPEHLHAPHAAATAGPTRASTIRSPSGAASSRRRCARLEGEERAEAYKADGRHQHARSASCWQEQLGAGGREGWYRAMTGEVTELRPGRTARASSRTLQHRRTRACRRGRSIYADFVIDCTGLEADIREHRVLADLLDHGGAGRNPVGRLDVERNLRGHRRPQPAGPACTPPAPRRSAATSPASTPSSGCRSPRRRSPTTSPGSGFGQTPRSRRLDPAVVALGAPPHDLARTG